MAQPTARTEAKTEYGRFVTFEGGEGAGKSTQMKRLAERLNEIGYRVVTTREPGGSQGAEVLRHVLLSGAVEPLGPKMEATLFAAARADHVDQVIRPALVSGAWVLCDRFADSTRVYQGVDGAVSPGMIELLERVALDGVRPDITLLLDVPAEVGLERAARRRAPGERADRFEKDTLALHRRRREAFLSLARAEPSRFVVVDATLSADGVETAIWLAVAGRLALASKGG